MTHRWMGEWPAWLDETDKTPACRGYDTDWWFPSHSGESGGATEQTAAAKAICGGCPLLTECRDWALTQVPMLHGIWGGMTYSARSRHPDRRRRGVQPDQFRTTATSTTSRSA